MSENEAKPAVEAQNTAPPFMFLVFLVVSSLSLGFALTKMVLRRQKQALPKIRAVGSFSLKERNGREVTEAQLKDKVWVVSFIFTRCSGPCPKVTAAMADLQRDQRLQDLSLVSVSVDPEFDTPKVLKSYAENFSADPVRWYFLTGPKKKVYELIIKRFGLPVMEAPPGVAKVGEQFTHSTRLVLVDKDGQIRGYYESTKAEEIQALRRDAGRLLRGGGR